MNIFLRKTATGNNSGTDWYNAITSIQSLNNFINSHNEDSQVFCDNDIYDDEDISITSDDSFYFYGGYHVPGSITSGYNNLSLPISKSILYTSSFKASLAAAVSFEKTEFRLSNTSNYISISCPLIINDCDLISISSGNIINNSNYTYINNSKFIGNNNNAINCSSNLLSINNTALCDFNTAITSQESTIVNNSTIHNCTNGINLHGSGNIDGCNIHSNTNGLITYNDILFVESCTLTNNTTGIIINGLISGVIDNTIIKSNVNSITKVSGNDFEINNSVVYPATSYCSGNYIVYDTDLENPYPGNNNLRINSIIDPINNISINSGRNIIPDNYTVTTDITSITSDMPINKFLYKYNNFLVISDYNREIQYSNYNEAAYNFNYNLLFSKENVSTVSSFSVTGSGNFPYDWEYFSPTDINYQNKSYLIPRTIVDLRDVFDVELDELNLSFNISRDNIKVFKKNRIKGISYDYLNSRLGKQIFWQVNEDHNLIYRNNNDVVSYPLFPKQSDDFVIPSGIIPIGYINDKYRFVRNDGITIDCITEDGKIEWLPLEIDDNYDMRGLLVYKDYIILSVMYNDAPNLVIYNTRDNFYGYYNNDPYMIPLNSGISPGDISVMEDGSLLIADTLYPLIHKHILFYDYAVKDNKKNNFTKFILRENYNDVVIGE